MGWVYGLELRMGRFSKVFNEDNLVGIRMALINGHVHGWVYGLQANMHEVCKEIGIGM